VWDEDDNSLREDEGWQQQSWQPPAKGAAWQEDEPQDEGWEQPAKGVARQRPSWADWQEGEPEHKANID
jgi:hypothetical protein